MIEAIMSDVPRWMDDWLIVAIGVALVFGTILMFAGWPP